MDTTLSALLTFYAFSTGRRIFAVRQVSAAAAAAGHTALAAHCETALAHDNTTRTLEARWIGQNPAAQFSPEARQIDILVDAALGALADGLSSAVRASPAGDPLGESGRELGKTLIPTTVGDITTLPYVEELAQVERINGVLESGDWSQTVKDLGLVRHASYLKMLEGKYREAIKDPGKLSFDEVKTARAKGQSLMLQAVAMILGLHPSDSAADLAARAKLLGPVLTQNAAIREYLKARRAVVDVDPETGQEETVPGQGAEGTEAGKDGTEEKPGKGT